MHPAYVRIDVAALRRMYVDERMTTTEIARGLKCGGSTVIRRLREIGIPRRPRGPSLALRRRGVAVHPEWSPDVAWVVGLKDLDLLESARRCLALSNRLVRVRSNWGSCGYRLQWRNRAFYDWLIAIGPTPRKSLTIGPLRIPDEYFADFMRGCIDGDGTILVYLDRYHAGRKVSYVYRRRPGGRWREMDAARATSLEPPLCETSVSAAATLDVPLAERARSRPQARQGRTVPLRPGMRVFLSRVPVCRNWQTIRTQNPVSARA
jgi:hypothetical protein